MGKTAAAIEAAQLLQCDIINADSRQVFRDLSIGTAVPSLEELALVHHHFLQFKNLDEYYSAAQFEADVMALLPKLWEHGDYAVMCGGSMLYVDAVCRGIDQIPDISDEVRSSVKKLWQEQGLEPLLQELERLDPAHFAVVDKKNPVRIIHAIEVCRQTGVPYSSLRTGKAKERPFNIIKIGLNMERQQLFERINQRVDQMIDAGLEQEARHVYPMRHLNSLNTVGYKEMFAYFDGTMDRNTAIERIKKNTRVYAKKQITWFQRDPDIIWCTPQECLSTIKHKISLL